MKNIFDSVTSALTEFENAANQHAVATEVGDYKTANKSYGRMIKAIEFIKARNEMPLLSKYLNNSSIGVRLWSSTFLLPIQEKEAIHTLRIIAKDETIHSLTAGTTIEEWEKGNLRE